MKSFTKEHLLLDKIAQRKHPCVSWWYHHSAGGYECLICDSFIGKYASMLFDHGLNHLKEKGLLAFT